jgi:hypothetical protein
VLTAPSGARSAVSTACSHTETPGSVTARARVAARPTGLPSIPTGVAPETRPAGRPAGPPARRASGAAGPRGSHAPGPGVDQLIARPAAEVYAARRQIKRSDAAATDHGVDFQREGEPPAQAPEARPGRLEQDRVARFLDCCHLFASLTSSHVSR